MPLLITGITAIIDSTGRGEANPENLLLSGIFLLAQLNVFQYLEKVHFAEKPI
jgi:hypothetical protein